MHRRLARAIFAPGTLCPRSLRQRPICLSAKAEDRLEVCLSSSLIPTLCTKVCLSRIVSQFEISFPRKEQAAVRTKRGSHEYPGTRADRFPAQPNRSCLPLAVQLDLQAWIQGRITHNIYCYCCANRLTIFQGRLISVLHYRFYRSLIEAHTNPVDYVDIDRPAMQIHSQSDINGSGLVSLPLLSSKVRRFLVYQDRRSIVSCSL